MFNDIVSELLKMTDGDPAIDDQIAEDLKDVEHSVEWHSVIGEDGTEKRIKRTRYGNVADLPPLWSCSVDEFHRDLTEAAARAGQPLDS
jgi:hypothetical protein